MNNICMQSNNILRKTKIIATIDPACNNVETLEEMINAGMNVARLNLSHGSYESHQATIGQVREAAENVSKPVAIMVDTRGIEIRTGKLDTDSIKLKRDDHFTLHMKEQIGDSHGVSATYKKLIDDVEVGQPILLDDGAIELEIIYLEDNAIQYLVMHGGRLKDSKGVNLPDSDLSITATGSENRTDIWRDNLVQKPLSALPRRAVPLV